MCERKEEDLQRRNLRIGIRVSSDLTRACLNRQQWSQYKSVLTTPRSSGLLQHVAVFFASFFPCGPGEAPYTGLDLIKRWIIRKTMGLTEIFASAQGNAVIS